MTRKTLDDWSPEALMSAETALTHALAVDGPRDHIGWGLQAVATLWTMRGEAENVPTEQEARAELEAEGIDPDGLGRPLPDAPGWWWGSYCGEGMRPVWVESRQEVHDLAALALADNSSTWAAVASTDWTWPTHNGKAVRVEPPTTTD